MKGVGGRVNRRLVGVRLISGVPWPWNILQVLQECELGVEWVNK